jgi:hypothetical protein
VRSSPSSFRVSYVLVPLLLAAPVLLGGAQAGEPLFENPIASDQLTFLNGFAGRPSDKVIRDGKFRKVIQTVVPAVPIHFRVSDEPLAATLETVLQSVPLPVEIRDGRYAMIASRGTPTLRGKGFVWVDMQDGIAMGGIFFYPRNGEPTPTVTVFSNQVSQESLAMSQFPQAFYDDLTNWAAETGVPAVVTRYFINAEGEKVLLQHDEDFCFAAEGNSAPPSGDCDQMNADASEIDMQAAYFLASTGYASNASAQTAMEGEQTVWIHLRDETCNGPDQLPCRIRMTRERTHVLLKQRPQPRPIGGRGISKFCEVRARGKPPGCHGEKCRSTLMISCSYCFVARSIKAATFLWS